ncbi:hypothetical protein MKW94_013469 [Papaver nudicaule]|uniref:Pentatricopeptide repeat-containing protein n=1 Tax=Papaver nudicaule TaxID=74823 RepID=A0AA41RYM1_PAPNU|nr:hypothetical protein [Papaver nudicaule]
MLFRFQIINFIFQLNGKFPAKSSVLSVLAPKLNNSWSHYHTQIRPTKFRSSERDHTLDSNISHSNWLITKLSREGKINEARKLFDKMPDLDVISWTTMITGYIKCGCLKEARILFDDPGSKKDVFTWTALLSGYVRSRQIAEAERLFVEIPYKNVVTWNTMMSGYANIGSINSALNLFNRMPERNVVSWNTIITALAQSRRVDEARKLFDIMQEKDVVSWTAMVTGLSKSGRVDEARELFERMPNKNVISWNAMVTGYAQNLRLKEAFEIFEKMPEKDLPSWNTMITGFIQNGDLKQARKLFNEMQERNVVTWTTMIEGFVQSEQSEEALRYFSRMQADGIWPNQGTFLSVLSACSVLAGLSEGRQIHQVISKSNFQNNAFVECALISMYSKCGELSTSREIFSRAKQKDLVSWNCMIAAYSHHGCGREAIQLMNEMRNLGFRPNDVTYVGILSACSHSGLVDEGMKFFDELVKDGSIELKEDHYACLVDLCGRSGKLQQAFEFIKGLGDRASKCVWGALLGGCSYYGNIKIGNLVAKRLLELEQDNSGTYLLLSNIHAANGNWKDAAEIRLKMKDTGLKKQPGCSWIEVGNRVNVFVVRDRSHAETELLYCVLRDLYVKMRGEGYLPCTELMDE